MPTIGHRRFAEQDYVSRGPREYLWALVNSDGERTLESHLRVSLPATAATTMEWRVVIDVERDAATGRVWEKHTFVPRVESRYMWSSHVGGRLDDTGVMSPVEFVDYSISLDRFMAMHSRGMGSIVYDRSDASDAGTYYGGMYQDHNPTRPWAALFEDLMFFYDLNTGPYAAHAGPLPHLFRILASDFALLYEMHQADPRSTCDWTDPAVAPDVEALRALVPRLLSDAGE